MLLLIQPNWYLSRISWEYMKNVENSWIKNISQTWAVILSLIMIVVSLLHLHSLNFIAIICSSNIQETFVRSSYAVISYKPSQPAFTCSNLTMKTLEQGVKYVQS